MGKKVYRVPARTVEPRLAVLAFRLSPPREVEVKGGGVGIVPRGYGLQVKGSGFPDGRLKEQFDLKDVLSPSQRAALDDIVDTIEHHAITEAKLELVDEDTLTEE
jgi:hypothetical protein